MKYNTMSSDENYVSKELCWMRLSLEIAFEKRKTFQAQKIIVKYELAMISSWVLR